MDVQNKKTFIEHSYPVSLEPETTNASIAENPSLIFQATGQQKWVKNKASNKRQKIAEVFSSNTEILQKLTEILIKEEKEDSEESVFGK